MRSRAYIVVSILGLSLMSSLAWAQSVAPLSQASINISEASAEVIAGSASVIVTGAELIVSGLETVGEFTVVTLKGAAEAGTVALRIPSALVGAASLTTGTTIRVVTESTGQALIASGKLIAFLPDEVGGSLLHHSAHVGSH